MEEVDGLFSSPEKSPARVNGFGYDDHIGDLENGDSASSEMSIDEGTLTRRPVYVWKLAVDHRNWNY